MGSGGGPPHRTAATASPTQSAVVVASSSAPDPPSRTIASLGAGAGQRMSKAPSATSYVIEYQVTFIESGLPSPMNWSVIFNTTGTNPVKETSNTSSITFGPYRNGTYSFAVGSVAGYAASPLSGNVTVSGKNVQLSIAFHPFTYSVTFTESGLPAATQWYLNVTGQTSVASASTTASISLPNGTYDYAIATGDKRYEPTPALGNFTVAGAALSASVTFTLVTYPVTFTESGLPSGTSWSVTLGGTPANSTTSSITFARSNGTWAYTVGSVVGYTANRSSGAVTVNGVSASVSVRFSPVPPGEYSVTFEESALPTGTNWSVTVNGTTESSSGATVVFMESNGTYAFSVGSVAGYTASPSSGAVMVNGTAVTESITFTPVTYTVTFTESGLPSGAIWYVNITGQPSASSTSTTIVLHLQNGTYTYTVATALKAYQPTGGSFRVNGANTGVSVSFTPVAYTVTFAEHGLPSGTSWSVTLNGAPESSTTSTITFTEANGTYAFSVRSVTGYTAGPSSGAVIVNGTAVAESITFTQVSYPVTFTESGLPTGTSWSVTLGGTPANSTTSSITFARSNGTYPYSIADLPGWHQATLPYTGSVTVNGSTRIEPTLTFAPVTYAVTFTESGLPSGTSWSVTLNGNSQSSTGSTNAFSEPNGTFSYSIATGAMYAATSPGGAVTVAGAATRESITFVGAFEITFHRPSGTPVGGSWTVYLNSTTGPGIVRTTSSGSLAIRMPNGTYSYSIVVPGSPSLTTRGTVVVQGSNVVANPSSATPSTFLGFPGTTGYYILAAVIVGLVLALAAVWALRRRPGKG